MTDNLRTQRGYAVVALYHPQNPLNVGAALRAAGCYRAAMVVTAPTKIPPSGSTNTMKAHRHMPYLCVEDLRTAIPHDCVPVAVDFLPNAESLIDYEHPERAFYVFGPENGTLGRTVTSWCRDRVYIPTERCMNLAATVNVVLYDRMAKILKSAKTDQD